MCRLDYLLYFIILLSSNATFSLTEQETLAPKNIDLGQANIEVVSIDTNNKRAMAPGIVIRIVGKKNNVESFGLSNEGGMILMPLPPGDYCYEAFTYEGKGLPLVRKGSRRCFSIEKDLEKTIGIEFLLNNEVSE